MQIVSTKDGSNTLLHKELGEHYHSIHGALQESLHVFIQNGLALHQDKKALTIFEMGFGTGLNALLAYDFARTNNIPIQYFSIEAYPLSLAESEQLNYDNLIKDEKVFKTLHEAEWDKEVKLSPTFSLYKIKGFIEKNSLEVVPSCDVIFYDAFAPEAQGHLWETPILKKMYALLKTGGHLCTYCAKGQFKRNLKAIGFEVKAVPGPPGKREITLAFKA